MIIRPFSHLRKVTVFRPYSNFSAIPGMLLLHSSVFFLNQFKRRFCIVSPYFLNVLKSLHFPFPVEESRLVDKWVLSGTSGGITAAGTCCLGASPVTVPRGALVRAVAAGALPRARPERRVGAVPSTRGAAVSCSSISASCFVFLSCVGVTVPKDVGIFACCVTSAPCDCGTLKS